MISTQIKAIVGQLSVTTAYSYGSANEINALMEKNKSWPIACHYRISSIPSSFTKSLAISNSFSLMIEFLYQSPNVDTGTSGNETLVQNALSLANEFMVKLANYRETASDGRFFRVHSKDKATIAPVYNKFDSNVSGVVLRMTVNTMYNDNVPLNA